MATLTKILKVFVFLPIEREIESPLGIETMRSSQVVDFLRIFEFSLSMAALFDTDSEDEFYGFTAEELPERPGDTSGESDISLDEDTIASEGGSSDSGEELEEEESAWTREVQEIDIASFEENVGPTKILPEAASCLDFFQIVFPEELIDLIVAETNRNAQQKQAAAKKIDKNWQPVNNNDIRAYLGIRLLQGIKVLPSERDYWSKNAYLGVKNIQDIMPRNRYLKINQYLHFNDSSKAKPRGHEDHDKLFLIRPLITKLDETFHDAYSPSKENAVDEGLVKFKGRLGFKQYMPLKPAKRGIKVWLRADSNTHYVSAFQVYTGRPAQGEPEIGLGARVVFDLSRDLVGGNYHLFFDNFFSSFTLLKRLKEEGIYATATTRKNRKAFPKEVKDAKLRNRGDSFSMQREGITACAWKDKKLVYFLTSGCQPSGDNTVNRRKKDGTIEEISAPPCVDLYNKYMGGVDYADQKRNDYRIPVKSRRWYRYLAFFLFETSVVNAFILRNLSPNHTKITQKEFRLELIDKLIGDHCTRKRKSSQLTMEAVNGKTHFPIKVDINRCVFCASKQERKRSTWGCALCNVTLCVGCFEPFHLSRC